MASGEGAPTIGIFRKDVLPAEIVACGHLWALNAAWLPARLLATTHSDYASSLSFFPLTCKSWVGPVFSLPVLIEVGSPWVKWAFEEGSQVDLVVLAINIPSRSISLHNQLLDSTHVDRDSLLGFVALNPDLAALL